MPERLPLNSQSLQKRFPEVYRDLFENYPIVTSSAVQVNLTANSSSQKVGAPQIWQKLPLRMYFGFMPCGSKFEIREKHFDSKINNFEEGDFANLDRKTINAIYPNWTQSRYAISGGKILIIWETGHARGLGASKYLPLAILPFLLKNETLIALLKSENIDTSFPLFKKSSTLLQLFHDAWELTILLSKRHGSTNSLNFSSFVFSSYPIITAGNFVEKPEMIPHAQFVGFRVQDISDPIPHGLFPDLALINPGSPAIRHTLSLQYEQEIRKRYIKITHSAHSLLQRTQQKIPFLERISGESAYSQTLEIFGFHTIALLNAILGFYNSGNIEDFLELCRTLRDIRDIKTIHEGDPDLSVRRILNDMSSFDDDISAVPLGVGSRNGDVLIIGRPQKYREHIQNFLHNHPETALEYASWIDGWGEEGFKVEQCLQWGLKSDFLGTDTVKLTLWTRKKMETRHLKYANIKASLCDILFDAIEEKVWVGGKQTTSKELPSQKGTVAIFSKLLEHQGEITSNEELEESSYKHYRNELQSKLISPLDKVLHQRINKKLGVTVAGGLTRFTLKFEPEGLKIGLIEKA